LEEGIFRNVEYRKFALCQVERNGAVKEDEMFTTCYKYVREKT